jgi:hypothetical protein
MHARFCPECGTKALPKAKFCAECGASLTGRGLETVRGGWQPTAIGAATLGFFLIAGLAIWAAILSPAPARPGPGGAEASGRTAAERPAGELPEGHPQVPVALPAEVKTFIADLTAKAKAKPIGRLRPRARA